VLQLLQLLQHFSFLHATETTHRHTVGESANQALLSFINTGPQKSDTKFFLKRKCFF